MNLPDQYLITHFTWMGQPYINKFGYSFYQTSWFPTRYSVSPREDPVCCVFYYCPLCHHLYSSRTSVEFHQCRSYQHDQQFDPQQTMHDLLILIAVNDLSFRTIDSPTFRKFVKDLQPDFDIPSEKTLRRKLIDFAEYINNQTLASLKGKYVSILFDGAKRVGINYEGIILYTKSQLYFYPFSILDRNTAQDIAITVAGVINDLKKYGIHVICACCDSASVNVAAFNKNNPYAIQYQIGEGIFRLPCCAHTAELASGDVFDHNMKGLKDTIIFILKTVPKGQKSSMGFSSTRWSSIYYCIIYICHHQDFYSKYPTTAKQFDAINREFDWNTLYQISNIMITLTTELEKDRASICEVYIYLYQALQALIALSTTSSLSQELIHALRSRFTKEGPMNLICASFLCSPSGYIAYSNENNNNMKEMVYNCALRGIKQYATERTDFDVDLVVKGFNEYINESHISFDGTESPEDFWQEVINCNLEGTSVHEFARIAIEIVQIPCSEASVERFFSHLEKILAPQRRNLKPKMIRAISIIKMHYLFSEEIQKDFQYPTLANVISEGVAGMMSSTFVPPVNHLLALQAQQNSSIH